LLIMISPAHGRIDTAEVGDYAAVCGIVVDDADDTPLPGASVTIEELSTGTVTNDSGAFEIADLETGLYELKVSHIGYRTKTLDYTVRDKKPEKITVPLSREPLSLRGITVTPGQFTLAAGGPPVAHRTMTPQTMESYPQIVNDIFRAVRRLPGITSDDYSTRLTIRGGRYDEIYASMDGLQLYEPFHLKDLDGGAMSIVDIAAVADIDVYTGAFTADYGDKMSGVIDIRSRNGPPDQKRISAGVSFMNAYALYEGTYNNNRGSWLLLARKGYAEYILDIFDPVGGDEIEPSYYDIYAKLQYQVGRSNMISASVLHAGDAFSYTCREISDADTIETGYDNTYAWFTLYSVPHRDISGRTVLSSGNISYRRQGQIFIEAQDIMDHRVGDSRGFKFMGFKSDWEFEIAPFYLLKTGIDIKKHWGSYDYLGEDYFYRQTSFSSNYILANIDTTLKVFERDGSKFGSYISGRLRPVDPLTFEIGVRYDYASYTKDNHFSPRVNFSLDLADGGILRGGWGYFRQIQGIEEISVADGEEGFYPAEKAEHRIVGLERDLFGGMKLRVEAYYKKYTDLERPDYRNIYGYLSAFPEREGDRIAVLRESSISRGIEFYLTGNAGRKLTWGISYVLARVEDSLKYIYYPPTDRYDYADTVLPSPNDQRHTVNIDVGYRPGGNWQINMAWHYHSGRPYTDAKMISRGSEGDYYIQPQTILGSRYKAYHRIDLRISRSFTISRGNIDAYLEVINLTDHKNVRNYWYTYTRNVYDSNLDKEPQYFFGILPSFGIKYELSF